MKKSIATFLFGALTAFSVSAQSYSLTWFKVAGGGGTVSGGNYTLAGTAGQHDASPTMTGGSYGLTGGFWAIYAVQTPGVPNLVITQSGTSAVVSWADTGNYTLLTNNNPATTNWAVYSGSVATANGTNSVTISPARGVLFFRLYGP